MRNILLIVADSLRYDTYNQISENNGYTKAMNSSTELSLPWMLSGNPQHDPNSNLPLDLKAYGYNTLMIHSNPIVHRFKDGFDQTIDLHNENRRARLSRRYNRVRDALQKRLPPNAYHGLKHMILGGKENYLPYCRVDDKLYSLAEYLPKQPWFVWLHLMDPHTPYYPIHSNLPVEKIIDANDNQISAVRGYYHPTLEEAKLWYSLYMEESTEMWRVLSKYLEGIDYGETAVIFTSDHGEEFGEHGHYGHKGNRFNLENIAVPFFTIGADNKIKDHSQLRYLIKKMVDES